MLIMTIITNVGHVKYQSGLKRTVTEGMVPGIGGRGRIAQRLTLAP